MAFKMKGSPMARNYGAPFNNNEGDENKGNKKSTAQSMYDKASQVGMGLKNVWDQGPGRSILLGDGSRQTTFDPVKAYKVGRDREKKIDDSK